MNFNANKIIKGIEAPPIAEAMSWISSVPSNRPLINLCQAVPSYPPAESLTDEIGRLAKRPETSLYSDILGIAPLRQELAQSLSADYQASIAAENIAITAGCNQAFATTMMALAESGDNVILPVPYYFNHHMWLEMLGIQPRYLQAINSGSTTPVAADAAPLIDERTRAIILCSPNNPTGGIYPAKTIEEFHALAKARGIALVVDETYKDFRADPAPPHGLFKLKDWGDNFIHLYSFSKVYALTGYRVGSVTAGPAFLAELEKILDCITICAPTISQGAALYGLRSLEDWKNQKLATAKEKAAALRQVFTHPGLSYKLLSVGAFFAYIQHPFSDDAKTVAKRLAQKHDLLALPGSMFGPGQEQYLRLAFANVEAGVMPDVVARLIESQS
ncbi:aminotransferase [Taklimakanibacter albus]|uniref:Aminotransferase n=1 Tax=Taklimakanibacter albus TaxID=2800327 RepID=A0ACC5R1A8_9HYPH|nr:aminotransferase [Aestuariivirga sp. YIM B02566]MBK1866435.1 aminotransferase [Aestuariivirga sp. YIM B02566]